MAQPLMYAPAGHIDVQMVFKIYGKFVALDYQEPQIQLRVVDQY